MKSLQVPSRGSSIYKSMIILNEETLNVVKISELNFHCDNDNRITSKNEKQKEANNKNKKE